MVECQSCGGRYEPIQADGMEYYHRCPPLSAVELQQAVDDGRVKLPDKETVDDAVLRRTYERSNFRDENRPSTRPKNPDAIKADGAGVVELDVDPIAAPVVPVEMPPIAKQR
jgi:hypothetical protein